LIAFVNIAMRCVHGPTAAYKPRRLGNVMKETVLTGHDMDRQLL
jgi:hypothetical protein